MLQTYSGHKNRVTCCVLSSNGSYLFSGSDDHDLRWWDVKSGKSLKTFPGHTGYVNCCVLTSNDSYLFSGGVDGILKCWTIDYQKLRNNAIQID